jgi:hypothetical protein
MALSVRMQLEGKCTSSRSPTSLLKQTIASSSVLMDSDDWGWFFLRVGETPDLIA